MAASRRPGRPTAPTSLGADQRQREVKLAALRERIAGLPEDKTAVFQDEVDLNTNPKIGRMWMEELLDLAFVWLDSRTPVQVEGSVDQVAA